MKKTAAAIVLIALAACLAFAQQQGQQGQQQGQQGQQQGQQGQQGQQQGQPAQKAAPQAGPSPEEIQAIQKMLDQNTPPDDRITAAETFLVTYPNSQFKIMAYVAEMQAYQDKNDAVNALDAADKVIKLDPNNVMALVAATEMIALRTRETDLDKDQKWKKGEDYGNRAIQVLGSMPKPPQLTDEQFQQSKNEAIARSYAALGLILVHKKQYTPAEVDFQKALDVVKQPMYAWHLGRAYAQDNKFKEACGAYQQAQTLGGVKNNGVDLADEDRKRLDDVMKKKGVAEGCPAPAAQTPAPATPAPPQKP